MIIVGSGLIVDTIRMLCTLHQGSLHLCSLLAITLYGGEAELERNRSPLSQPIRIILLLRFTGVLSRSTITIYDKSYMNLLYCYTAVVVY